MQGGLVFIGIPCASWIWLSRGTTRRSRLRPKGAKRYARVRATNKLVRRVLYLFLGYSKLIKECQRKVVKHQILIAFQLATCCDSPARLEYLRKKDVMWIIEQPSSSLLPFYKPMEAIWHLSMCPVCPAVVCVTGLPTID